MYEIATSQKMENGVVVFYQQKGTKKFESFNHQELIDQKINALDLLEYPHRYSVDTDVHRIYVKDG